MKNIYLKQDTRDLVHYKEYVGKTFKKRQINEIFIMKLKLYDPSIQARRKQKVNVMVIKTNKKAIEIEVI